jgi:L-histidine Nalpha-methyltransferase
LACIDIFRFAEPHRNTTTMSVLRFYDLHQENQDQVRQELSAGLLAPQAHTSPKYLYDALGSRLFDAITELPEYYPTRTEASIFKDQRSALTAALPSAACMVDLGAGSCAKAASLFGALQPSQYVAVDISTDYLRSVLHNLQQQNPTLPMAGVGTDFAQTLDLPAELFASSAQTAPPPVMAFYPGSSIGNFTPGEALAFLQRIHAFCMRGGAGGGLLVGVDLVKAINVLEPAYDDPLGVTAAFNLNMLRHINTLIGSNFDVRDWQHVAFFNTALSRIEMHVEAKRDVRVAWGSHHRNFKTGERIHTENSYKWTVEKFSSLLQSAGFKVPLVWTDARSYFAVFWAQQMPHIAHVRNPA